MKKRNAQSVIVPNSPVASYGTKERHAKLGPKSDQELNHASQMKKINSLHIIGMRIINQQVAYIPYQVRQQLMEQNWQI